MRPFATQDDARSELCDMARLGYWELDAKTRVMYWSETACDMLGLPREAQGDTDLLRTCLPEKEFQRFNAAVQACLATGEELHAVYKVRPPSGGTLRSVECRARRKTDTVSGEPVVVYGTLQDITQHLFVERQMEDIRGLLHVIRSVDQLVLRIQDKDVLLEKICKAVTSMHNIKAVWIILAKGDGQYRLYAHGLDKNSHKIMQENVEKGCLPPCYQEGLDSPVSYQKDMEQCNRCFMKTAPSMDKNFSVELRYEEKHYGMMGVVTHLKREEDPYASQLFAELGKDIAFSLRRVAFIEHANRVEKLHTSMFNSTKNGVFVHDLAGNIIDVNPAAERLNDASKAEILKHNAADFYLEGHEAMAREHFALLEKNGHAHIKTPLRTVKGKEFYAEIFSSLVEIEGKTLVHGTLRDITDAYEADKKMRQHHAIALSTKEGICITDASVNITYVNESFTAITGYSLDELKGHNPSALKSGRHDKAFYQKMWKCLEEEGVWQGEIWNRRKTGQIFPEYITMRKIEDATGRVEGYVAVFNDLSVKKLNQRKIDFLSTHDPLTKLPNRQNAKEKLDHLISNTNFETHAILIASLDIDHFKTINDSFGHALGDKLLVALAKRVQALTGYRATLGRLGADEFVLFQRVASFEEAMHKIQALLEEMQKPFEIEDKQISITLSVGASMAPEDAKNAGTLIKNADTARHKVKQEGKHHYTFYKDEMTRLSYERVLMTNALREAIENEDFTLFYQPLQALDSGKIVGVEALLRWESKAFGTVSPVTFIPLAEETKLIVPLGTWVIDTACRQLAAWKEEPTKKALSVAINISGVQLYHSNLVAILQRALARFKVDARLLKLEITESTIMGATEETVDSLKAIKAMGISLSIDDFGTGYSSLSRLKKLPVDVLKVDKSFTVDVPHSKEACVLSKSILSIAKQMGLGIVVEGIETKEQRAFYENERGCVLQGYYLAKPMPISVLEAWLEQQVKG
jgi:diguanylate cyclase (GGDEF)-like protein/PAS domain S-box-containing protein